ncbi:GNAT family N-acetyltransferase [Aquidulcibacter sp.]|uniref:GNAT family N-acetyltransferase n=1 Tax=Aquidulcibacter sp. TaxID=2052990 RepID=UPI0025C2AB73|nr:GNAT family N-acetyltransferase [Aquidulcibacter sp.]MCA3695656.1 GNAT family N-acetyltransferase [Aquidulcibacter sp.]
MQVYKIEHWDSPRCIAQAEVLAAFLDVVLPDDWSNFAEKLAGRRNLSAHVALDGQGRLIGLKLGYERNRGVFNSWIGGVAPEARGQGIASALMDAQHVWAKEAGFRGVETATRQPNRAMAILNLKAGYMVAGLDATPGEPTKILYYKGL